MGLKAILRGVTVTICAITASNAADFGTKPPSLLDAPYVTAAWDWTGFYGGWSFGYGTGDASNYVSANDNSQHGWANNNPSGVLVGGTIGYNYQYAPNWVVGAEADLSWSSMQGNQHMYIYDGHDWSGGWDGFGTIRARLGYALDGTLFYGTGGVAFVHSNEVIIGNDAGESNFGQGWYTGYVIGAGVEHAFTGRLSAKLEFLFADGFDEKSGTTGTVSQHGDQTSKHDIGNIDILRVGLNYKF